MLNFIQKLFKFAAIMFVLTIFIIVATFIYFERSLPKHAILANYEPPITSRLYASDGSLVDEYAKEKRSFVPIKFIPKIISNAFLAAEDSNFYNHPGIDIKSLSRAMYQNLSRVGKNQNFIGGSTITQQVVKNILLTKERTISRKIKEAILAIRISSVLDKDRVLELYLNEIYLGYRSYGVAAAALNYFNKSLDELSIAEAALLAAMPKAPTSLDPKKNYDKALDRRNWVISRMEQEGFIDKEDADIAISSPIIIRERDYSNIITAGAFSEAVRKELTNIYSEGELTEKGLVIYGTLEPKLQRIAANALRSGLEEYDARHGYRGPIKNIDIANIEAKDNNKGWEEELSKITRPHKIKDKNWDMAIILELSEDKAIIGFEDSTKGSINISDLEWAKKKRQIINEKTQEMEEILVDIKQPSEIFNIGDVILVEKKKFNIENQYLLRQIPQINGAIVIMNPHDGKVLSMVGGYSDQKTEFNRAMQAYRQPGSVMKPFTYLAALEQNLLPTTIIIDDEVRMKKEDGTYWVPMNYSNRFYGPTPMRIGLEKSRNVVTVRLAEMVSLPLISSVISRYGISQDPITNYAMVLGSLETTLLKVATGYSMIANGGKKISPYFIEKVQNKAGTIILKRDVRKCIKCNYNDNNIENIKVPEIEDDREQIMDPRSAYQAISLLEGAIIRGTGWKARNLAKPMAGKTGTTNNSFDAWFVGFAPDLVIAVWAGYDTPRTLGKNETGSSVALPIFINAMKEIQKQYISRPFKVPEGIKFVKIDRNNGRVPGPTTLKKDIIFEAFKNENFSQIFQYESENNKDNYYYENDNLDYELNIY